MNMFSRVLHIARRSIAIAAKHEKVQHIPVLSQAVTEIFSPISGQKYLDMTFGAGGHTKELLKTKGVTVYALDRDPVAYELAVQIASKSESSDLVPMLGKFSDLHVQLSNINIPYDYFDGILIDCGCSSMQFDDGQRGFSLSKNGPLDMRMDKDRLSNQPSAADVLAHIDEEHLARVLKIYGEEKQAKKIARAIIEARYLFKPLKTTWELAELVESVCGFTSRTDKLQRPSHVATKTFQALRILVNDELNELDVAMRVAAAYLKKGGKIITLSFHSLEDRIIKNHLTGIDFPEEDQQRYKNYSLSVNQHDLEKIVFEKRWQPINKHVIVPSAEEVSSNPRSRSAKLRAAVRRS